MGPILPKSVKINIVVFQAALPKPDLKPDLPESLFNDLYQVPRCKIESNILGILHEDLSTGMFHRYRWEKIQCGNQPSEYRLTIYR